YAAKVEKARRLVRSNGLYGHVSIEQWTSPRLPYADNTVNLLVAASTGAPPQKEIMRVLCPGGVAKIGSKTIGKPWPEEYDAWGHFRHGADGNPVSNDSAVALPRNIRWVAAAERRRVPLLSAGGRNFYGQVFVRDAFNGLPLWEKRGFVPHVAARDLVYGVQGGGVVVLDASNGNPVGKIGPAGREATVLLAGESLVVATQSEVRAHDAATGRARWAFRARNAKCVVVGDGKVFLVSVGPEGGGPSAACLDLSDGKEVWRSKTHPWLGKAGGCSYGNGFLAYEVSSLSDDDAGNSVHLVSAETGKHLWSHGYKPGMTHSKQSRAFFLGENLWIHSSGFTQLDLRTGKPVKRLKGGGGHCYPAVATRRFLIGGELNFTDVLTGKHERNAITKGECAGGGTFPGWIPANGLLYGYKGCRGHCICFPMIEGCLGLAPSPGAEVGGRAVARPLTSRDALVKGPAKGLTPPKAPKEQAAAEWPCYRHDCWRSGGTASPVDEKLRLLWAAPAGRATDGPFSREWKGNPFVMGPATAPVVAGGMVFVALPDAHQVVALNAATGKVRWTYTANGRIDTPPTYHDGLCIFGTRSGYVHCVLAADGELVWRLRAGPEDRRIVAWGQLESAWPVPGSVLAYGGSVYFAAGRSALADGGLHVYAVKARTGQALWGTTVAEYGLRQWYGRLGWDYDPVDLPVFDGKQSLAVGRARIDFRGGKPQVRHGEGSFCRNESGAWVPVGTWAYGTAINRQAQKRPLWVFRDRTLYGPPPHGGNLRESGGNVDSGLNAYALPDASPKAGGREWGPFQHFGSLRRKWSARTAKIAAMAVAGEALFVIEAGGRLLILSTSDGKKLSEQKLPGPPVWDGVAAAYGRLYITLADGTVLCLGNPSSSIKVPKPIAPRRRFGG
ncbi:MAG: outer membrane protein assembly factor BamB family protein, partial [Planctomycetota bacterium]